MTGTNVATIEDMDLVGHTCLVPDSQDHLWEATARWFAGGLDAGERILYFENQTADAVLDRLADDRVEVDGAIAGGQLVIVPTERTHTAYSLPVPDIEELVRDQVRQAYADGWAGLRLAGESGGMIPIGGLDKVVDFELAVDRIIAGHPSTRMLCRYDRRHFDDDAVAAMRSIHRTELVTPAIYDDTLLRVTSTGPAAIRLAGEVDHSNRPSIPRVLATALDSALRSHSAPTDIVVDLSSLRFLDVAGAVELVHAAENFPITHRLVLTGARSRVLRVLDRCGAPFAPQLVVRSREGQA